MSNITIVKPSVDELSLDDVAKLVEDIWEAWDAHVEYGLEIQTVVEGFDKKDKPIYRNLDPEELTPQQILQLELMAEDLNNDMEDKSVN